MPIRLARKFCIKCNQLKPIEEFYKHPAMADGYLGKCKECTKKDVHENYYKNREHYINYEKERNQEPERKENQLKYSRQRRDAEPEKYKAHNKLNNALRDGKIKKKPCEICRTVENLEAHHDDYSKPLDVKWFCQKHHKEHHKKFSTK